MAAASRQANVCHGVNGVFLTAHVMMLWHNGNHQESIKHGVAK